MDVEDWFHLEYINNYKYSDEMSMKDGIQKYLNLLSKYDIKANFFIVGNFVQYCPLEFNR